MINTKEFPPIPYLHKPYDTVGSRDDITWLKVSYGKAAERYTAYIGKEEEYFRPYLPAEHTNEDATEQAIVAVGLAKLTRARLLHAARDPLLKLVERHENDGYSESKLKPVMNSTYDAATYRAQMGISLDDIFQRGLELAQQRPVEVYGHMLLSTHEASTASNIEDSVYNFMPIATYSPGEAIAAIRQATFPEEMNETFLTLSRMYHDALGRIKGIYLDPDSPEFPKVVQLYEELFQNGTSVQFDLFFPQLLGIDDEDEGRLAYSKIRSLAETGRLTPFHQELLTVIENVFEGKKGEDVCEAMGVEMLGAQIDENLVDQLHTKRRQLFKAMRGVVNLADGTYGELELSDTQVHHQKHGEQTYIQAEANVMTASGEAVPIFIRLYKNNSYEWNFLQPPRELPELFNMIAGSIDQILDTVHLQLSTTQATAPLEETVKSNAVSSRRKNRGMNPSNQDVETANPAENPVSHRLEVDFSGATLSPNKDIQADAEEAIRRYKAGHANIALVQALSRNGPSVYRLKKGGTRVLCVETEGRLVPYKAGPRSTIYNS